MIGTASARLLAMGASRRERLHALALMGLLCDHADTDGCVRMPFDLLCGEFSVPPARGRQLLDLLVEIEVVNESSGGLSVAGKQPAVTGGLRLAGFLANVAAVLDDETFPAPPRREGEGPSPELGPAGGTTVQPPARPWAARLSKEPVLAAVGLAVLIMLATFTPSNDRSTALRTMVSSSTSVSGPVVGADRAATATATPTDTVEGGALSAPPPAAPASPDPDTAGPPSAEAGTEAATPARRAPATDVPPGDGSAQAGGGDGRPDPDPVGSTPNAPGTVSPQIPPFPSPSPNVPPLPSVPCPGGAPLVRVDGERVIDNGVTRSVEVTGAITNPTTAGVVVESYEVAVTAGGRRITTPGPLTPVTLASRGLHQWTVTIPVGLDLPLEQSADARIVSWSWADTTLGRTCPA